MNNHLHKSAYTEIANGHFHQGLSYLSKAHEEYRKSYGNQLDKLLPKLRAKENPAGKRILFYCEQGLGDQIASIRFAKWLADRGAIVDVVCRQEMIPMFSRIEGIQSFIPTTVDKNGVQRCRLDGVWDCWVPGPVAPLHCGLELRNLPNESYLNPCPIHMDKWASYIPKTSDILNVGIRWQGGENSHAGDKRALPVKDLVALCRKGVKLHSLQRDAGSDDLKPFKGVVDLGPKLVTWDDTAAAISQLDVVITCCTSVAHLSAALGKPTWILSGNTHYHLWATPGDKSTWYPTANLFRQDNAGDWSGPMYGVRGELRALVAQRTGVIDKVW